MHFESKRLYRWSLCLISACYWIGVMGSTGRSAENWPMWRYDAQRTAASPNSLPADLRLLWKLELPPREPVWDDPLNQDLMTFDRVFEPIVMDGRLIIGFNDQDKVVAVEARTGKPLWTYFTDAPVRLPPVGCATGSWFVAMMDICIACRRNPGS